jgi:hypothetical protein
MLVRLRWRRKFFIGMSSIDEGRCCYCPSMASTSGHTWFIWSIQSVSCVWMNQINQMNQRDRADQMNQTDRTCLSILLVKGEGE